MRSATVGACQGPDFDVFDAATMQQTRNPADRRTGSDDVINNGNIAVVAPWRIGKGLAQVVDALVGAQPGLQ